MKLSRVVLSILACFAVLSQGVDGRGWILSATTPGSETQLLPGVAISGTLGTAESVYWFTLKSGVYFELAVQKSGTDVTLSVLHPDGRIQRAVKCSHDGPLRISELASGSGRYAVRAKLCNDIVDEKAFEISLSQPRTASRVDRRRVAAQRLSADADSLIAEYRAQSARSAIRKYEEAIASWAAIGDHTEEAGALNRIASLYRDLGDLERANNFANRALGVARSNGNSSGEAEAYLSLAMVHVNQGDADKALESASRTVAIARNQSNRTLEAEAQYFLGNVYYESLSNYEKATEAFEEARRIWRQMGNRIGEARTLLYLAAVDFDLSRINGGPEMAQKALAVFDSLQDKRGQALSAIILGLFQWLVGRNQEALNLYERARVIVADSGDLSMEATVLNGLARFHQDLGEYQTALQFFETALSKNDALHDRVAVAYSLWLMGECYFASGDSQKALSFLTRGLSAFSSLSNKKMEGRVLRQMGLVHEAEGDRTKALDVLNRSLELSRAAPDQREEAASLAAIGHILETGGDTDGALRYYEQVIALNRVTKDMLGEVSTLYHIAHALRAKGRLQESRSNSEAAIRIIEGARTSVVNSALRRSYFASVRQHYELYTDVLMRLYRERAMPPMAIEAFEASERSRARTLLDTIAEARLSFSEGIGKIELERELSLKASLDAKSERYTQLLSSNASAKDIADLSSEIQRLTAEYEALQAQIRLNSPRYAALVQPQPLRLAEIQNELLDSRSLLLEYALGDENSYLWAITRGDFASFVLPTRSEIEKKVRQVRELMTARVALPGETPADLQARFKTAEAQYPQAAAELSRMLLGPVADRLGARRLVIVAEGVLQYLPFGALPAPHSVRDSSFTPLTVEHEIVNLPSASTLAVIRREGPLRGSADRTIAVFADPVFGAADPRVRRSPGPPNSSRPAARTVSAASLRQILRGSDPASARINLPRLPATRQEADAILAMAPADQRMAALGFDATKAMAMNAELKRYRIVHFATHTILNDDHPDLSSLVLSLVDEKGNPQNGFLWLRDMYNLQLAAELVVLSACDTALGKDVKGEGLMSMVRGFMYSGTPRVLASLWKVDDEATAELMKEFYKHLLQEGLTPADALRQAQITQMVKRSRQSPYYWAAFQLQGEWN